MLFFIFYFCLYFNYSIILQDKYLTNVFSLLVLSLKASGTKRFSHRASSPLWAVTCL